MTKMELINEVITGAACIGCISGILYMLFAMDYMLH